MDMPKQRGVSLIEVFVILSIITVSILLLIPTTVGTRTAARRAQCVNNMKQIALATANYESSFGTFPSSLVVNSTSTGEHLVNSWSVFGRLATFLEESIAFNQPNYSISYEDMRNSTSISRKLLMLWCPAHDPVSTVSPRPYGTVSGTCYAFCMGDWYVWGGLGSTSPNRSMFGTNQSVTIADIKDGLSNTILAGEVKSFQSYLADCGGLSQIRDMNNVPKGDVDFKRLANEYNLKNCPPSCDGHTNWADGGVSQTGFTTAWTPNMPTGPNRRVDYDLIGRSERLGGPTFAAVTSRSYHDGGVNVSLVDGSVRFMKNTIDGKVWRALGTIAGGEVLLPGSF